jgi:hypothetical protein
MIFDGFDLSVIVLFIKSPIFPYWIVCGGGE